MHHETLMSTIGPLMEQAERRAERTVGLIRIAIGLSLLAVFAVTITATDPAD